MEDLKEYYETNLYGPDMPLFEDLSPDHISQIHGMHGYRLFQLNKAMNRLLQDVKNTLCLN